MVWQGQKQVIFHIDDLWSSIGANRAAFALFWQWEATSGSIIVPGKAFNDILKYNLDGIDLWVHLTLTSEWDDPSQKRWPTLPISQVPTLVDKDWFFWKTLDEVFEHADPEQIYHELNNQIKIAREAWIKVSHIDSHMGVLLHKKLFHIYAQLAIDNKVQPFICYPRKTDWLWHRFFHCEEEIKLLICTWFKVLDAYEPNSLYQWSDHTTHSIKRIERCTPWTTYFLMHVLNHQISEDEKTPDYKARQSEYQDFISWKMSDAIISQNIIRIPFI